MKKQFIVLFSLLFIAISVSAQKEYKLNKSSGTLNLNIPGAIVEGYSGNQIIFSLPNIDAEAEDERAKGLKMINSSDFEDNTGLGLDVTEKGSDVNVNVANKSFDGILTIKVPQNVKVLFTNKSNIHQSEIILKNLKGEIEVSTSYNKIKLENNSGPMNVKTLYGSIDASFADAIKGPVSIVSVYGYVDVALQTSTKANVNLSTTYGKLYAADGLKIAIDRTEPKEKADDEDVIGTAVRTAKEVAKSVSSAKVSNATSMNGFTGVRGPVRGLDLNAYGGRSSDEIKGTLNGGGANLILKSSYSNVYLRVK